MCGRKLSNELNVIDKVIATNKNIEALVKESIEKYGNKADLNYIDVSNVTDMKCLFAYSKFNGDISNWNVSNVSDMDWMFSSSVFNKNISKWDVSNVNSMRNMFYNSPLENNTPKWYNDNH